jgi:hypothetical protein
MILRAGVEIVQNPDRLPGRPGKADGLLRDHQHETRQMEALKAAWAMVIDITGLAYYNTGSIPRYIWHGML